MGETTPQHTFTADFVSETAAILTALDQVDVESVVDVLVATRERGGRLFFCGSGGGAGHSSHATADFRKLGGFEAYSVSDNVSEITARVNDEGWDTAYSAWLAASNLRDADCLFVFSVGGGSEEPRVSVNLVRAIQAAVAVGADVVGIVGRQGGYLRQHATASILVPTRDAGRVTPQVEGMQAVLWHLLVSHPRIAVATAAWESLTGEIPLA